MSSFDSFVTMSEVDVQRVISEVIPTESVFVVVDLADGLRPSFDFHLRNVGDGVKLVSFIHGDKVDHFALKMDDDSLLGFSVVLSLNYCGPAEVISVEAKSYDYDTFLASRDSFLASHKEEDD